MVLIQSVVQAISFYIMSYFHLPKGFVHELNMLISGFWWGDSLDHKKIHWKSWESLCVSKLDGGIGSEILSLLTLHC